MRFGSILGLLVLYVYQCNGVPPKEVAAKPTKTVSYRYTEQEDRFIIEEISRLPLDSQQVFRKSFWEHIANMHREKWIQKTRGFPQERGWSNLRDHLKYMLKQNNPELTKKLPEDVLRRYQTYLSKPAQVTNDEEWDQEEIAAKANSSVSYRYTQQEETFMIDELLRLPLDNLHVFSNSFWAYIAHEHRKLWKANTAGFPQERSSQSLRSHLIQMVRYDNPQLKMNVPEEVLRIFRRDLNKPAGLKQLFTKEEDELIIEELLKPACYYPLEKSILEAIVEKHDQKLRSQAPGFTKERTASGIRSHINTMNSNGLLPEKVVRKFRKVEKGASSSDPTPPDQAVDSEETNEEDGD